MTTLILGSILLFLAVTFFSAALLQHNANRREVVDRRPVRIEYRR